MPELDALHRCTTWPTTLTCYSKSRACLRARPFWNFAPGTVAGTARWASRAKTHRRRETA